MYFLTSIATSNTCYSTLLVVCNMTSTLTHIYPRSHPPIRLLLLLLLLLRSFLSYLWHQLLLFNLALYSVLIGTYIHISILIKYFSSYTYLSNIMVGIYNLFYLIYLNTIKRMSCKYQTQL